MKTLKLAVVAAAILAAFGVTYQLASAEVAPQKSMGSGKALCHFGKHHRMGPGAHLDRMTVMLGLNQEQRLKILPILDQKFQERKAIWQDGSLTRDQRQAKMQELRETYHNRILALLTPEQRTKAEELRKNARERRATCPRMNQDSTPQKQ